MKRIVPILQSTAQRPSVAVGLAFGKKYSAQLAFGLITITFLAVSVGEGSTYDIASANYIDPTIADSGDFLGKPQIFAGQTVLTGEVQQTVAMIYKVEPGDSLVSIAKRYDLSAGSIIDANNLDPIKAERIQAGTELLIPAQDTNTSLAWLDKINKFKEDERQKAEAARQKQLALQQRNALKKTTSSRVINSTGYGVIGTLRGGYNGGAPGQCTWYANYKRPDLPNGMGNGGQYLASARRYGLATGSSARAGAIMVTNESYYGHVAYVESVSGGMVTITEMNYVGPYIVSRRTVAANSGAIKGYIY